MGLLWVFFIVLILYCQERRFARERDLLNSVAISLSEHMSDVGVLSERVKNLKGWGRAQQQKSYRAACKVSQKIAKRVSSEASLKSIAANKTAAVALDKAVEALTAIRAMERSTHRIEWRSPREALSEESRNAFDKLMNPRQEEFDWLDSFKDEEGEESVS